MNSWPPRLHLDYNQDFNSLRRRHTLTLGLLPPLRWMPTAEGRAHPDRLLPMDEMPQGERDEEPVKAYSGPRKKRPLIRSVPFGILGS